MIDAHVHLAYSGITQTIELLELSQLIWIMVSKALRGYSYAKDHMKFGFTSLRDMNAPGRCCY